MSQDILSFHRARRNVRDAGGGDFIIQDCRVGAEDQRQPDGGVQHRQEFGGLRDGWEHRRLQLTRRQCEMTQKKE